MHLQWMLLHDHSAHVDEAIHRSNTLPIRAPLLHPEPVRVLLLLRTMFGRNLLLLQQCPLQFRPVVFVDR